jgi:hypothetical protein
MRNGGEYFLHHHRIVRIQSFDECRDEARKVGKEVVAQVTSQSAGKAMIVRGNGGDVRSGER